MPSQKEIKIVQWNCRSLRNKLSNFKLHIYTTKPHVICLCETWLSTGHEPRFINYTAIYKHREDGTMGGGLAILIRSDVSYLPLTLQPFLPSLLEVQGVKILLKNNPPISIINLYNPNKAISLPEYEHYINQVVPSSLIVGDFNAHYPHWEPGHASNIAGRNLHNFLLQYPNFALLTPPALPTYFNVYQNSFSTLDLTIITTDLQPISSVSTLADLGSDHYPVLTTIGVEPTHTVQEAAHLEI